MASSRALDQTRRAEAKRLAAEGDDSLKSMRYLWLQSVAGMPMKLRKQSSGLLETSASFGEVCATTEAAPMRWQYKSKTWA